MRVDYGFRDFEEYIDYAKDRYLVELEYSAKALAYYQDYQIPYYYAVYIDRLQVNCDEYIYRPL